MRVNFFAPMYLTLAVLPLMLRRRGGRIVNVSGIGGRLGIIHEASYCASKSALCGWSEALAVDLHGTGVSVNLIEPGPVEIWDSARFQGEPQSLAIFALRRDRHRLP
jgi:short-subunit dehydrogenase